MSYPECWLVLGLVMGYMSIGVLIAVFWPYPDWLGSDSDAWLVGLLWPLSLSMVAVMFVVSRIVELAGKRIEHRRACREWRAWMLSRVSDRSTKGEKR